MADTHEVRMVKLEMLGLLMVDKPMPANHHVSVYSIGYTSYFKYDTVQRYIVEKTGWNRTPAEASREAIGHLRTWLRMNSQS